MERLAYEEAGDLYGMALQAARRRRRDADDEVGRAHCRPLRRAAHRGRRRRRPRRRIDALEPRRPTARSGWQAWYTTYEGLLAVLAEPDRLTEIVQSIGAAAAAMRAVGDLRGEAKAHYVHALALERLGPDRCRRAGARPRPGRRPRAPATAGSPTRSSPRRPPAALWGPSPVTRASGRCLDVVRVLRITDGAPAVEAVALRCQAVLEALRGRIDAGRAA